jgi:hypothetical protein
MPPIYHCIGPALMPIDTGPCAATYAASWSSSDETASHDEMVAPTFAALKRQVPPLPV